MGLLAELYRLRTTAGSKLIEETAGVSLNRILADEETIRNFAVAQSGGNKAQNLQLAGGDAKLTDALLIGCKDIVRRRRSIGRL